MKNDHLLQVDLQVTLESKHELPHRVNCKEFYIH